ncbi:hypothetical protein GZ176_11785 [Dermatophilus congolensis]|nr:hypothetical protein [Dermatophilus congolensis]MBO3148594.1 hypothetical protein [Dermatophilus congolensis]MBO3157600.1 hypothetical protein [Dermatophilus congolensis]MBO3159880.1 hypothetical protein [Dermatophilus congolensis]MBO3166619.1 hypothetical protein [Dermatophilus congolensis]
MVSELVSSEEPLTVLSLLVPVEVTPSDLLAPTEDTSVVAPPLPPEGEGLPA